MTINIEEYYKKYGPMVLRRCRYLLKDEDRALDAMQDVFVKLLTYKGKFDGKFPSGFLYRIATNVCLNIIRSEKKRMETMDGAVLQEIAGYDGMEERILTKDLVDNIFKNEKPSTREIALMLYVDNMTLEETAKETGLSVSGVRKRMRVLKERIASIMEEKYEFKKNIKPSA